MSRSRGGGAGPSGGPPPTLAATSWRAVTVSGAAPVGGREPTLAFAVDRISGSTGCNQFFGGYTYADGTIEMSNVGMTLMACEDAISMVEGAYLKALNGATTASLDDGGQLLLGGSGGEIRFAPEDPRGG